MTVKESYQELVKRQLEGVMFHRALEQCFSALKCPNYQKYQCKQAQEEFMNVFLTTSSYTLHHGALLQIPQTDYKPDFIQSTWYESTPMYSEDEKQAAAVALVKRWADWEEKTLAVYESVSMQLPEDEKQDKSYIELLEAGVKRELQTIYDFLSKHI